MEATRASVHEVYRKFTLGRKDRPCLLLDVRPYKAFKRRHVLLSYCVRLTADKKALLDYSKNEYDIKWVQHLWWNADVVIVGEAGLKKDNEVAAFLAKEGRCSSVAVVREGVEGVEAAYPFLVGQSLNAHRGLHCPSLVEEGFLYLGSWDHASDAAQLKALGIKRIITIHNEPKNLKLVSVQQMAITLPDLPSSDISSYFDTTFKFIEAARAAGHPLLVHCGAGTSRSAAICAAYLMRRRRCGAATALRDLLKARSLVCPNEGFWLQLCDFEDVLGLPAAARSDPAAPPAVNASFGDVAVRAARKDAAGGRVEVQMRPISGAEKRPAGAREGADGDEADVAAAEAEAPRKRPRGSSRQVSVEMDVQKEGRVVGSVALPALQPFQKATFGRGAECDVKLEHASLSRTHAQLATDADGRILLTDLGSAHGTNVNGMWVKANEAKELVVGSRFRFAASSRTFIVRSIRTD